MKTTPYFEVRAIDGPVMKDWGDGVFLCQRPTFTAAERARDEFAPRWPGKTLIIIQGTHVGKKVAE